MEVSQRSRKLCKRSQPMWTCTQIWWNRSWENPNVFLHNWIWSSLQIPLMIFALFLGPWSDAAGRKLLIAFPFFGNCLTCIGFILNVYFFDQLYVEFLWIGEVTWTTWTLSSFVLLCRWLGQCLAIGRYFFSGCTPLWLTTLLWSQGAVLQISQT